MPYCVRCGVELQKKYRACPLCQTEVILPDEEGSDEEANAFSDHMPTRVRPRRVYTPSRSFLFLATFLLVVPMLVTFFIDFTGNGTVTWSFYPMTALALLWILLAYPALLKGHTWLQLITVDIFALALFLFAVDLYSGPASYWFQYPTLSLLLLWVFAAAPLIFTWRAILPVMGVWFLGTAGFLYAIDSLTADSSWFLGLGLPILSLVFVMGALGAIFWKTAGTRRLLFLGMSFLAGALFFTGIDVIVNLFVYKKAALTWSPALSAFLVPTAVFVLIVNGNPELKAYLQKKFHV